MSTRTPTLTRTLPTAGVVAVLAASAFVMVPANARAETRFQFDVMFEGFYAFTPTPSFQAGGATAAVRLGAITWFANTPVGLLYTGGVGIGPLLTAGGVRGTTLFSGDVGLSFLLSGTPASGTMMTVAWAPKLLMDFPPLAYAGSPGGAEISFDFGSIIKLPFWFLRTLPAPNGPAGWLLGSGFGFDVEN